MKKRTILCTEMRWNYVGGESMDVRGHFKEWCDKVFSGETLIISRPKNEIS